MNRLLRVVLLLAVGIGASALVSYLIYNRVLRPAQAREDAFAAYRDGSLKPDSDGQIDLSPRYAKASLNDRAYVTRESSKTIWMLFLSKRGTGRKFAGYLYCTRPAATDAKGTVDLDYGKSKVTVKVLRTMSPWSFEVASEKE